VAKPADPAFRIEALGRQHVRESFHCGEERLDRYLRQQARQDADKRVAAPFVVVAPPSEVVLGFYTLSASAVRLDELPADVTTKLPHYPLLPVTLIGRLAVEQSRGGQGIGELLLLDALHRSFVHAGEIAALAVVVDAKNEKAATFYARYGFVLLQEQPRRLFLPMKTVERLFGPNSRA